MNRRIEKMADAYKVEIFIGGDYMLAVGLCADFCNREGLCVTVDKTVYVYTGGVCDGVKIGLINYARFPKSKDIIWRTACALAIQLKRGLGQGSYTVQDNMTSLFVTDRDEDQ